jgi:hypothetical protein
MFIINESKESINIFKAYISKSLDSLMALPRPLAFLEKFIEKDVKWCHLDISGAGNIAGIRCKFLILYHFSAENLIHYLGMGHSN